MSKVPKICDAEDVTAAGVVNVTGFGGEDICFSEVINKAAGNSLPLFMRTPPTAAPLETNVRNEISFKFGGFGGGVDVGGGGVDVGGGGVDVGGGGVSVGVGSV